MNVGSLFSGIGGIDLGLERAGMRVVWQVECDPYARAVLRKHWPEVPCYEDVRNVGAANLAPVDLVCGGFPCQDISVAGKNAGITAERSGLWREYARILRELRPRYVLVENVAALLARGFERVAGDLAALGFDAEWDCLPAHSVGAPHIRDRVFLVAYPARVRMGKGRAARVRDEQAQSVFARSGGGSLAGAWPVPWIEVSADLCRVGHGLPHRLDRGKCLGNAVVPQVAEYIGRLILAHAKGEAVTQDRPRAAPFETHSRKGFWP